MNDPRPHDRAANLALVQALRGWRAAGLTHLPRAAIEVEVAAAGSSDDGGEANGGRRTAQPVPASEVPALPVPSPQIAEDAGPPPHLELETSPMPVATAGGSGAELSGPERERRLKALAKRVAACTRCQELASTRTQTVFGVGNPEARVMFIGEAPGADEDRQGEPFVGRAGQLLNKIIAACGWTREELYICNILRCRPPGNRTPSDEEAAHCREYLDGQIATVNPEYIVCWGSVAARNLLNSAEPIGRLREKWFEYGRARVLCTYHPSYLLRNPEAKKPVWEDMQRLLKAMGLEPPQR